jgi:hypothetical protein
MATSHVLFPPKLEVGEGIIPTADTMEVPDDFLNGNAAVRDTTDDDADEEVPTQDDQHCEEVPTQDNQNLEEEADEAIVTTHSGRNVNVPAYLRENYEVTNVQIGLTAA